MRKLIFVRHSQSKPQPGVPPSQWPLSEEGKRRCLPLATSLAPCNPVAVVSSREVKAKQTAAALAAHFSLTVSTSNSLHEHERTGAPFLQQEQFLDTMRTFFEQPEQLVFGNETAAQALQRFRHAVDQVLNRYPDGNLILVTHGTVLSLFVAYHTGQNPFTFWQQLEQPAYVLFNHPPFRLAVTAFTV